MEKKERIIELVRQNVISTEEALDLLEAAGREKGIDSQPSKGKKDTRLDRGRQSVEDLVNKTIHMAEDVSRKVVDRLDGRHDSQAGPQGTDFAEGNQDPSLREEEFQAQREEIEAQMEAKDDEIEALEAEIQNLDKQIARKEEALIIAEERERELEILSELDDLTEEMQAQKDQLHTRQKDLKDEIHGLQVEADQLTDQITANIEGKAELDLALEELCRIYGKPYEGAKTREGSSYADNLKDFGSEVYTEGRRFGSSLSRGLKKLFRDFDKEGLNINVTLPWTQKTRVQGSYQLEAEDFDRVNVDVIEGDFIIESHPGDQVLLEAELIFYGEHKDFTAEHFHEMVDFKIDQGQLDLVSNRKRFGINGHLKVPDKVYHTFKVNLINGNLDMQNIQADSLDLEGIHSDLDLVALEAQTADLMSSNGDAQIRESDIQLVNFQTINGDFRIAGNVYDLKVNSVNSDVYVTKHNLQESRITIQTTHGDSKIAYPQGMPMSGRTKTSLGEVKTLIDGFNCVTVNEGDYSFSGPEEVQGEPIQLDIDTVSGDTFIKYSQQ